MRHQFESQIRMDYWSKNMGTGMEKMRANLKIMQGDTATSLICLPGCLIDDGEWMHVSSKCGMLGKNPRQILYFFYSN